MAAQQPDDDDDGGGGADCGGGCWPAVIGSKGEQLAMEVIARGWFGPMPPMLVYRAPPAYDAIMVIIAFDDDDDDDDDDD